ncbi:hypothetical protein FIBSPDRAFT_872618 [Athelia psychrophila]|uniref:Uncharacterized protein n=1 Tax=Athelia psychrophila TaxID=1759441 RepID=A0A165ZB55_9AGAM|nr:hypothetical protein FIBSPDRAFT_872618 [Fibularhizoctonia sp. CBS 109695]
MESVYAPLHNQWVEPLKARYETILQTYRLDEARLHSPYPPGLLAQIKQARRERWANKTRELELERERRGEVVARTIRRRRQAHKVARNVSRGRICRAGQAEAGS